MKNQFIPVLAIGMIMLSSCQSPDNKAGDFNLLPLPQKVEFTGVSGLSVDDVLYIHSTDGTELPVLGKNLKKIQPTDTEAQAQIVFHIENSLDLKSEGYTLEISKHQVSIIGKDKAGLLYGFMTLDQLVEDATEQDVPLPLCHIEDYPLLAYRAIHIDVKHHREKTEYYYQLMDKLAGYKVNAIIAEMEDKLGYERQPMVGSADAMSIAEWIKLSDYAMERNIEISPLIQGLPGEFDALKANLEKVYGEIRILTKPEGYILDQDHHTHLANQSIAFDWLFIAEKLFLEKVESTF